MTISKGTILFIDDDQDATDICCGHLNNDGYTVLSAYCCTEALRIIQQQAEQRDLDIVITDYHLGDGTRLDVVKKTVRVMPTCKVILMTADESLWALSISELFILRKPFTFRDLDTTLSHSMTAFESQSRPK